MTSNIAVLLSVLVTFQLSFIAIYLFTHKKGNKRNNRILASVFLIFAINLLDLIARITGYIFPISTIHLFDDCLLFLYGPAVYFYTQGVVYRDHTLSKRDAWHLSPYIILTIYLLLSIIFAGKGSQSEVADKIVSSEISLWISIVGLLMYFHILIYLWYSWRTISIYQSILKEKFSSIDKINLNWLNFMIRTFAGIIIVAMISNIMPVFGSMIFLYSSIIALLIVSFYFVNRVIVKALNQPALFSGIYKVEVEKYAMSNLEKGALENYKDQLNQLMQKERPYLSSELKIKDLAEKLSISSKILSQVINQGFNQNFYDFINTFRCEEVKRILNGQDKKVTIIEAMYQSGFNSKSSFNKEFKKLTGQTPSEYKKSLSEN